MSLLDRWRRGNRRLPTPWAPGQTVVRVGQLDVALGGRTILDGVDLDVRAGQVVALVGPNGAGKSTLLGAISGDVPFTSGTLDLDGAPESSWTPAELALRRAVLPQQINLSFPFSVRDVVAMGRAPWAGTDAEVLDDAVVASSLRRADVADLADRRFTSLSGGEKARVCLARVLAQQAALLLLDEPTAALDLHHQELVLEIAKDAARRGGAVVVVLHDLALAAAHADYVAVLAHGRIVAYGPPSAVFTPALLSEVYHHEIEVLPHPTTGLPLVFPRRGQDAPSVAGSG